MSDQHNRRIAGFAGDSAAITPNLDRLAAESIVFDNAYCQFPLCTPSRIGMWTGRLPHDVGGTFNYAPIPNDCLTMPGHFERHGYTTCGVGKMHVGGDHPMNGFMHRPYGDLVPNCFCGHQPDPVASAGDQAWTRHDIGHFPFAGVSELPEEIMQESVVTREALSFIRAHGEARPDQPWFVCASYARPHHPVTAPSRHFERFWPRGPELPPLPSGFPDSVHPHDRFIIEDYRLTQFSADERRKCLAAYYASLSFLDECIGDLLEGLRRDGLLDNTVIVYTSDHGDMMGEHGLWWKRSYYDGSAAVPLLIRTGAPMAVRESVSDIVELLDLFPTLCDLAGLPHPDGLDGESLVRERRKEFARCEHIARSEMTFRMIRTMRWKYVEFPEYRPVLFNMLNDPGETENLAGSSEGVPVAWELHRRLWDDGQTFEQLMSERLHRRERAMKESPVSCDRSPNQYALPGGETTDAERAIYEPYLLQAN